MISIKILRTFHPVGQGAFYSERFEHEGRGFTIVYDCGTTNSNTPPASLCKESSSSDNLHQILKNTVENIKTKNEDL